MKLEGVFQHLFSTPSHHTIVFRRHKIVEDEDSSNFDLVFTNVKYIEIIPSLEDPELVILNKEAREKLRNKVHLSDREWDFCKVIEIKSDGKSYFTIVMNYYLDENKMEYYNPLKGVYVKSTP